MIASTSSATLGTPAACPHLGKLDDDDTYYRFACGDNRCWRLKTPAEVVSDHQTTFCLGTRYAECPIYTTGKAPPNIVARGGRSKPAALPGNTFNWRIWVVVLEVLLLIGAGAALLITVLMQPAAPAGYNGLAPLATPQSVISPPPTMSAVAILPTPRAAASPTSLDATFTPTATVTPEATVTPGETATFTPAPAGDVPIGPLNLVVHSVQTNENLITIAARYNTTTEVLMKVNGLSQERLIQLGQVLVAPVGYNGSDADVPRLIAFQTAQDTSLTGIAQRLSADVETVRTLNALGPDDLVPAGRWLFVPQP